MDSQQPASWAPASGARDYKFGDSVGYLIKRVRMAMTSAIDRELVSFDISHDQFGILLMIASGMGTIAAELSREMACDTSSMTRMIDRLEAKGLVTRTRSEDDRRIVFIVITETGRVLADQLPDLIVRVTNFHLRDFSLDEVELMKSFLRRMLDNGVVASPERALQRAAEESSVK